MIKRDYHLYVANRSISNHREPAASLEHLDQCYPHAARELTHTQKTPLS